jgi:4-amino-4-deoxychorismate lyase
MASILLKKSYYHRNLKEIDFHDLWNSYGIFTTMRVVGKPFKILFFEEHIKGLINSLKDYNIYNKKIKENILKLIQLNLNKNIHYNHLLRVASNNKIISISLRKQLRINHNFTVKIINYKRIDPEYKNLKYKKILNILKKIDIKKSDILLKDKNKILETGTANVLFIKNNKIYSPVNKFYKGTTLNFFIKKLKTIKKRDIFINSLNTYDEIILIGSGKGVVSVKYIQKPYWKRKSLKTYRLLLKIYEQAVTKCPPYYS